MDRKRRNLLRSLALGPIVLSTRNRFANSSIKPISESRLQYSVNAYSFNSLLRSGEMTFFDMMEFAAEIGLNAVDLTGYYFPSYPEIPEDRELFLLKRKALELGLNISWTGVRNNFVTADVDSRKADQVLIQKWLGVSAKLGATIMRVFTGRQGDEKSTRAEVNKWLVDEYKICASHGEEKGVIVGLQNHNEFLFDSEEVIDVLTQVDSDWFGLILDIGSLRGPDPYAEIEKLAPYANYWFIKEHVFPNGERTTVDMQKITKIIKNQGYQGYISFESLSKDEDPKKIIGEMLDSFRKEYNRL